MGGRLLMGNLHYSGGIFKRFFGEFENNGGASPTLHSALTE